jgi:hypothetical protein
MLNKPPRSIIKIKTEWQERADRRISTILLSEAGKAEQTLFYEFTGSLLPSKPKTDDFALLALLPYAMGRGADLHINGTVTTEQIERFEEQQDAWTRWHPNLFQKISLTADREIASSPPASNSAVLSFSGGIDATFALYAHKRKWIGRRSRDVISAVMIHGYEIRPDNDADFQVAHRRGLEVCDALGVGLTAARTNWREFQHSWRQAFIFGIAAALNQFSATVSRGVIATDEPYEGEILGYGNNSITNQMMGNSSFPLEFTGAGYGRTQKAQLLKNEDVVLRNIRVCSRPEAGGKNCGECKKCIRSKLNFLAARAQNMPALGRPFAMTDLQKLDFNDPLHLSFYREMLAYGDWSEHREIEEAIRNALDQAGSQHNQIMVPARRTNPVKWIASQLYCIANRLKCLGLLKHRSIVDKSDHDKMPFPDS